jgi:hypothetical protein
MGFDFHLLTQAFNADFITAKDVDIIAKNSENFITMSISPKNCFLNPMNLEYPNQDESAKHCNSKSTKDNINNSSSSDDEDQSNSDKEEKEERVQTSKVRVKFIDSCQFLHASLDKLIKNIKVEGVNKFKLLPQCFGKLFKNQDIKPTNENLDLLSRKLNFPYSYLKSCAVLKNGAAIPDKSFFTDDLNKYPISEKDWGIVQKVIDQFKIKDFREYTRVYCMLDSILLAEVWEDFVQTGLENFGLDPNYCISASMYFWQCFLYQTKTELDYMVDEKMIQMIQDGIRGGPCYCTKRVIKANNERYPKTYNPSKERTQILYVDKNSLYAEAMTNKLPHSNFKWVPVDKLKKINWNDPSIGNENDTGYILNVSLRYPESIHNFTSDIPYAPENRKVQISELSPAQTEIINEYGQNIKNITSTSKLLLTCYDKHKYTIHYKTLQYYLMSGMELIEIHSGIQFTEKAYIRDYILGNLERRKLAKTATQRDFLKLANNIIYGKCLQQVRNRVNVRMCTSKAEAEHYIASPYFKSFKQLTPKLSMILLHPKKVIFNKPIYAGFTTLELAKIIYYTGYYQELKSIFGDRITCAYLDTDSGVTLVRDPDNTFFADLVNHKEYFDFSDIPENHDIFKQFSHIKDLRTFNRKKSGLWKIVSIDIAEGIFLKSKQYSLKYFDSTEEQKCKGVPQSALKNCKHKLYKEILKNNLLHRVNVTLIRSLNHRLYKIRVNKIGFHTVDIKRIYPNPADMNISLPFGHYLLQQM